MEVMDTDDPFRKEILGYLKGADTEDQALMALMICLVSAGRVELAQELSKIPPKAGCSAALMADDAIAAARQLAAVCGERERIAWGRAFAWAVRRGDQPRLDYLAEIARRRCCP